MRVAAPYQISLYANEFSPNGCPDFNTADRKEEGLA